METKQLILAGILYAVIAQVVYTVCAFVGMSYYLDENYFCVWSKLMMPGSGPPPFSFTVYSIVFSLVSGMLFAVVYLAVRDGLPGGGLKRGLNYGLLIFLVAGIPTSLMLVLLINLPLALIILWGVESLIIYPVAGVATAKVMG